MLRSDIDINLDDLTFGELSDSDINSLNTIDIPFCIYTGELKPNLKVMINLKNNDLNVKYFYIKASNVSNVKYTIGICCLKNSSSGVEISDFMFRFDLSKIEYICALISILVHTVCFSLIAYHNQTIRIKGPFEGDLGLHLKKMGLNQIAISNEISTCEYVSVYEVDRSHPDWIAALDYRTSKIHSLKHIRFQYIAVVIALTLLSIAANLTNLDASSQNRVLWICLTGCFFIVANQLQLEKQMRFHRKIGF